MPPSPPDRQPADLPVALGRLRVALTDAYARAAGELGLSAQQAELLCAAMRPSAIGAIAGQLRCDRSNVSRLVDRAYARGLVGRQEDDDDARLRVIALSPEGERLARSFLDALELQTKDLRAQWSSDQQDMAVAILGEIAEALDALRPPSQRRKRRRSASRASSPSPHGGEWLPRTR